MNMILPARVDTIALHLVLLLLACRRVVLHPARSLVSMVAPSKLWHGRITQAEAAAGYEHLQSIYRSEDHVGKKATASAAPVLTKTDAQFEAAKHLFLTSARLGNAVNVLEELVEVFTDPDTSRTKIKEKSAQLKKYIIPLLSHAAETLDETGTTLSPIASVKYVHNRKEQRRKKDVVDPKNKKMGADLQLVAHHVHEEKARQKQKEALKSGRPVQITPPKKKSRRTPARAAAAPSAPEEEKGYPLPPPAGGKAYTKDEVVAIVSKTVAKTNERGAATRAIIAHQKEHGVKGCSSRTIRRMMLEHDKKKAPIVNKEWSAGGRTPMCNDDDLKAMAMECETHQGKSFSQKDVKEMIQKKQSEKLANAGVKEILEDAISDATVRNYSAALADEANISISKSTVTKSNTRDAAENSIRGSLATLHTVASTHFIPVEKEDPEIRAELRSLPPSTRLLINLVCEAYGAPVYPIDQWAIFSTDDTTEYIFEGSKDAPDQFVLTTKSSIKKRGTNAIYNTNDNKSMRGMRVKLTFTFSALGTVMPLVVTVSGLSEREMPEGKEFIHVKVPNLCIGGGGVNVENRGFGHLLLMRDTEGAERERCQWYQKNILIPGVNAHRKQYGKFDTATGRAIPDRLTAVCWCDGDLSQIHAVKNGIDQLLENKIICNKQHAARTAVEQPADLSPIFKIIKQQLPNHTVTDLAPHLHPVKEAVFEAFQNEKELADVRLGGNKKNSLIDFLAVLPDIVTGACTKKNIQHGFIAAGIIDKESHRFPVFDKILSTCRRNPTKEEYDNILDTFPYLFEAACEHGHISEELFDLYGIVRDRDSKGNEVLRDAGISQEHCQRTKCLTHEYQIHLRKERLRELQRKERKRKMLANSKHQDKIDANRDAVYLLCKELEKKGLLSDAEREDYKEEYLERCPVEMFDVLKCPELDAFIMAHQDPEAPQFTAKSKIPKKGTIEEAREEGAFTKIRLAFDCRTKPNSIEGQFPYDLSDESEEVLEEAQRAWDITSITLGQEQYVLPSTLLSDKSWVQRAIDLFDLEKFDVTADVTQEQKEKADLLVKILRERYMDHVKDRIEKKSLQTHWTMRLALQNLSVSAACMVLSRHVKMDLSCLGESDGLLACNTNNFFHASRFPAREGAYLYFDENRGEFVRSGKVTGRGFVVRGDEHEKGAKAKAASSHFYFMYPSSESERHSKRDKQGLFESLTQIIAAGYDPKSDAAKILDKDWTEGGLLILSDEEKNEIKSSMGEKLSIMEKFRNIVSYQIEFGYDLALCPGLNVSRSPGFESALGIFGGVEYN